MKLIKDIRLFELGVPNIDGNPTPYYIGRIYQYDNTDCLDVIERLVLLLRHRGFGFDTFDHLYLNITPCISHGEVRDVNRYNIREFSWYHYVDIGCDTELFNRWELTEKTAFILEALKNASLLKTPEDQRQLFTETFEEVLLKGDRLLLPYRRKENANYTVEILVRINDELDYIPWIRVTDKDGSLKAEKELRCYQRDELICQMSNITINKRSVRITPRKNWYTEYFSLDTVKLEW